MTEKRNILPSDLLMYQVQSPSPVAIDTETSGLFPDDGARVAVVSIAFEDPFGKTRAMFEEKGLVGWTYAEEEYTPGLTAHIVSMAWPFDQGATGTGKPEDTGQEGLWPEAENLNEYEWESICQWLYMRSDDNGLTMHNAKFDVALMRAGCRRWDGNGVDLWGGVMWDTQTGCDLLYPLHPTSLKPTASRLWGTAQTDESTKVQKYLKKAKLPAGRWDLVPWDIIGPYADKDARLTLMLTLRQMHDIDNMNVAAHLVDHEALGSGDGDGAIAPIYDAMARRMMTTQVLLNMESRGLPYDEAGSREAAAECLKRATELEPKLPFAPTGPAAKDYFFTDGKTAKGVKGLDMVPYSVTEKGAPQLTAEILLRMVADRVPHANVWNDYTKVVNAASMWYEGYADRMGTDGRLRTNFRQNGTRSTRFSVERVNLQAIPQDYRLSDHAILSGIPTPRDLIQSAVEDMRGWRMYELDLAQAELRVGAMFANCVKMLEMISNDEDLHTYTTRELFPDIDPEDPLFKSKWRQVGKRGNFSLQFGSAWATFKAMVSKETGIILDEHESKRIVRDWNALYPEYGQAIVKHMRKVEKRQARHGYGWVETLNGERRWFQPYEEAHKAFNQRVQANLAQFGIDWMLMTDTFLREQGLDESNAGLILTIHDSQMLLLPDNADGEAMAEQCAEFGRSLWKRTFPGVPGGVDAK